MATHFFFYSYEQDALRQPRLRDLDMDTSIDDSLLGATEVYVPAEVLQDPSSAQVENQPKAETRIPNCDLATGDIPCVGNLKMVHAAGLYVEHFYHDLLANDYCQSIELYHRPTTSLVRRVAKFHRKRFGLNESSGYRSGS